MYKLTLNIYFMYKLTLNIGIYSKEMIFFRSKMLISYKTLKVAKFYISYWYFKVTNRYHILDTVSLPFASQV